MDEGSEQDGRALALEKNDFIAYLKPQMANSMKALKPILNSVCQYVV